jgi:uncharacterized membrane protein (DUF106 family)
MKNNEELKKEDCQKEYKKDMQTLYIENQKFLAHFIAIISILAFPFLYHILSAGEMTKITKIILIIALSGFGSVMFLQTIATKIAAYGCNYAFDKENKKAIKCFNKVEKFTIYRDWCFLLSVVLTTVAIIKIFS